MKKYDFSADIKDILKEEHKDNVDILDKKFAYTYLVFDCDAHHNTENENRELKDVISDNFSILKEMMGRFVDESCAPRAGRRRCSPD